MVRLAPSAAAGRAPRPPRGLGAERGSQSLELAMALPIAVVCTLAVLAVGLLAVDATVAATAAREVARAAAVGEDHRIDALLDGLVGPGNARWSVHPPPGGRAPGHYLEVEVEVRGGGAAPLRWARPWIPGRATMRWEGP